MKRHLMTLVLGGFVGALVLAGDAQACHKKKAACAPAPVPCVVVEPAPCPPPAPVAVCEPAPCTPKKKCGLFGGFKGLKLGCHKKAVCAPPVVETCAPAPCGEVVAYTAPVTYSAPAVYTSPQTSAQH
jgi:hypothetical protein